MNVPWTSTNLRVPRIQTEPLDHRHHRIEVADIGDHGLLVFVEDFGTHWDAQNDIGAVLSGALLAVTRRRSLVKY